METTLAPRRVLPPSTLVPPAGRRMATAAALGALAAVSAALRVGVMHAGYWTDEAISVGVASHPLSEIPGTLREDGSPPLYYLLLHGWMQLFGKSEPATRSLSLLFALVAIPVAWWAGRALFGARAGWLAAAGAAGVPFLTRYAQETRMYSLVAVLSLVACAAFVLAFMRGRREHLVTLTVAMALLLYTHNWALFLGAGFGVVWLWLWRRGHVRGRDGALVAGAVAVLYAPWFPTLAFQVLHTGAPWAQQPSPAQLFGAPGLVFGIAALPLLGLSLLAALARRDAGRDAVVALLVVGGVATLLAWLVSQIDPVWALRYLAIVVGPWLLALAGALARGGRWTALALVGVAAIWLASSPPPVKSNARAVSSDVAPRLRPGDAVVSTQPEQVPVLNYYLPAGLRYFTPAGIVTDPGVTDWINGVQRLRAARVRSHLDPIFATLAPGQHLVLVTPVNQGKPSKAPLPRAIRLRTHQWRAKLRHDPRLRRIATAPASLWPRLITDVRAEVYVRVKARGRSARAAHRQGLTAIRPVSIGTSSRRAPVSAMNSSTARREPSQ